MCTFLFNAHISCIQTLKCSILISRVYHISTTLRSSSNQQFTAATLKDLSPHCLFEGLCRISFFDDELRYHSDGVYILISSAMLDRRVRLGVMRDRRVRLGAMRVMAFEVCWYIFEFFIWAPKVAHISLIGVLASFLTKRRYLGDKNHEILSSSAQM